jgi:hypothetical protein
MNIGLSAPLILKAMAAIAPEKPPQNTQMNIVRRSSGCCLCKQNPGSELNFSITLVQTGQRVSLSLTRASTGLLTRYARSQPVKPVVRCRSVIS